MKLIKWLDKHLEETLVGVLLAAVTVLMIIQVLLRYIFASGLSWSEVVSRYILVLMGFLSLGYGIRHKSNVCIDMLIQIMPSFLKRVCGVTVRILVTAIILWLLLTSIESTMFYKEYGRIIAGTAIPVWIVYAIGPTAGLLIALFRTVQITVLDLKDLVKKSGGKK